MALVVLQPLLLRFLVKFVLRSKRLQTDGARNPTLIFMLGFPPIYILAIIEALSGSALQGLPHGTFFHTLQLVWIVPIVIVSFIGAVRAKRAMMARYPDLPW